MLLAATNCSAQQRSPQRGQSLYVSPGRIRSLEHDMSDEEPTVTTSKQLAVWVLCGLLMSLGMSFGGMAHESSLHFFDPFRTAESALFDWSMLILFCAALIPTMFYWQLVKRGPTPWFDTQWHLPTNSDIDRRLVFGSAIFGAGWALGGFCPGPPVAGLITGHPNFVAFSYGMYGYYLVRHALRRDESAPKKHWGLTLALGALPAIFYFVGPTLFPMDQAPHAKQWPLMMSIAGGFGIGLAVICMYQFNGRVLGVCGLWRSVLDMSRTGSSRLPHALFFVAFMTGSVLVYFVAPEAFASPPNEGRAPGWIFAGGLLVAHGTHWANGCTSGHGIAGFARLSVRSLVAVPTFMAAVFICYPLFNMLLGD